MDRLPFEVLLQIFEYLPLSSFKSLYAILPQAIVDEALVFKLRNNKKEPVVSLISTNLHELSAFSANTRNESSLSLYFNSFDPWHRFVWIMPDFSRSQHYFRVKDAYVSHGKLVLRRPHDTSLASQKSLVSLWDIRKSFPPTRAGSFSGVSEYSKISSQELTIYQTGCILDSCLIPSGSTSHGNHIKKVSLISHGGEDGGLGGNEEGEEKDEAILLKRPSLPSDYLRQVPMGGKACASNHPQSLLIPTYPDPTCGYFLVERLAVDIPTLLGLYC